MAAPGNRAACCPRGAYAEARAGRSDSEAFVFRSCQQLAFRAHSPSLPAAHRLPAAPASLLAAPQPTEVSTSPLQAAPGAAPAADARAWLCAQLPAEPPTAAATWPAVFREQGSTMKRACIGAPQPLTQRRVRRLVVALRVVTPSPRRCRRTLPCSRCPPLPSPCPDLAPGPRTPSHPPHPQSTTGSTWCWCR